MPNTLGTVTKSLFFLEVPSDEIHLEFTVAAGQTVYAGSPVELETTTGKVKPITVATTQTKYIGICLQNRAAGETVTVATVGLAVIWAESKAAQDAGPAKYDSYNATSGYHVYDTDTVTAANQQGWALNPATGAGEVIQILVKE